MVTGLYILFIFSNSLMTGEISGNTSGVLSRFLMQILQSFGFAMDFDRFHFFIRKLAHFSEYFLLSVLVILSIRRQPWMRSSRACFFLFMIAVPLADECIQHFIPGRYGAFTDCLIDMSGYLAAGLIFAAVRRAFGSRKLK